jgi:hypothetical protein
VRSACGKITFIRPHGCRHVSVSTVKVIIAYSYTHVCEASWWSRTGHNGIYIRALFHRAHSIIDGYGKDAVMTFQTLHLLTKSRVAVAEFDEKHRYLFSTFQLVALAVPRWRR